MNASLHQPKSVRVTTLSGGVVVLSIEDEQGNDVTIFFDGFTQFINTARQMMTGEAQGKKYTIQAGE
jgi:tRNA(Ile2) C34 agmatinyltransferase TiaS